MRRTAGMAALVTALVIVTGSERAAARSEISYEEYQMLGFPCGTLNASNHSSQYGQFNWLQYTVSTSGALDICGQWFVTTSASVSGVSGSSYSKTGVLYSSIQKQVPVPHYNTTYVTSGTHVATTVWPLFNVWQHTQSSAYIQAPPPEPDPSDDFCDDSHCLEDGDISPIIIDTRRNGYHLTGPADGVWFDLDADGIPERVSWTRQDSDDAFLAMDRNGNGRIDDGSELFGNHTPAFASGSNATAANGFEALRFLEWAGYGQPVSPASVDEVIDANDPVFGRLLLWRDANHNGISEPEELSLAVDAGIVRIETEYRETGRIDRFGNQFRQRAMLQWSDGARGPVYDIWLRR